MAEFRNFECIKQSKVGFENVKTCQFHMFYDHIIMSAGPKRTRRRKHKKDLLGGVHPFVVVLLLCCGYGLWTQTTPVRATGSGVFTVV